VKCENEEDETTGKGLGRQVATLTEEVRWEVRQQLPTDTGNDRGCRVESLCGYRRVLFVVVKMVLFFYKKKKERVNECGSTREKRDKNKVVTGVPIGNMISPLS